ncbi:hypothetical protein N7509_001346 [Penicillium cosmopolitanum]|uniref:Uncharacterized protein n=1 Tax=Penicillium cosmopolitanum TaxID=1131564 RepID=A0A9W9WCL8_9EURO|nr:uncharacterized protein N7509_001346 [Penicillium cosmopolitanum]KAJ5414719.1 hypothetical protein N7509_001346 [Penicillium cosmopolitanum]
MVEAPPQVRCWRACGSRLPLVSGGSQKPERLRNWTYNQLARVMTWSQGSFEFYMSSTFRSSMPPNTEAAAAMVSTYFKGYNQAKAQNPPDEWREMTSVRSLGPCWAHTRDVEREP